MATHRSPVRFMRGARAACAVVTCAVALAGCQTVQLPTFGRTAAAKPQVANAPAAQQPQKPETKSYSGSAPSVMRRETDEPA
ncbi:MAG: hypothetical protein HQL36_11225, partial [Alphaproteobacteria bacterium]|nr:hypothetical protein [Alphaproteobacteria bacterium]